MKNYILHLDTSGNESIAALSANGVLLMELRDEVQRNHAASINQMIQNLLNENDVKWQDLNAVSIVSGPGSYTGLRIGMATAKGICYALNIPLLMHDKLELLMRQQWVKFKANYDVYVCFLRAREGEYFMASMDKTGQIISPPFHAEAAAISAFSKMEHSKILVTGIWDVFLEKNVDFIPEKQVITEKIELQNWILSSLEAFQGKIFASLAHVEPLYLKEPFTHKSL